LKVSTGTKFLAKKKWRAGVEPGPLRLENLALPLRYTVLSVGERASRPLVGFGVLIDNTIK